MKFQYVANFTKIHGILSSCTDTSPLSVYFVQKIVTHQQLFFMCVVKKNVVFVSSSLTLVYVRESESSEALQESKSTFPSLFLLHKAFFQLHNYQHTLAEQTFELPLK